MSAPAPVAPLPGAAAAPAPSPTGAQSLDRDRPGGGPLAPESAEVSQSAGPQPVPARSGQSLAAELRGSALLFAFSVGTTLGTVSALTALQRMI